MSDFLIRHAVHNDAEQLYHLRLTALKTNPEAFGSDYDAMRDQHSVTSYARRIPPKDSDNCIIVAEIDEQLVGMIGFIRAQRPKTQHSAEIWGVFVMPDYRGQGVGRLMMTHLMAHLQTCEGLRLVSLSVVASNTSAVELYQSLGFDLWGTQPIALKVDGVFYDMHWMSYQVS